ncbi:MAG: response regulator [Spirochaetes bacterium]|nr:response regulator [Spirochaetota bacterium]
MKSKKTYHDEISVNVGRLEKCFNSIRSKPDDFTSLKEALNLIKIIGGTADMNGYKAISRISNGLIPVIEDLIENKISPKNEAVKLFNLSISYYRTITDQADSEANSLSVENILDAYKSINSGTPIDITEIYQKDILQGKTKTDYLMHSSGIDSRKKVEITLQKIDNAINKLNDIVLNQYQLKYKVDDILKTETGLSELSEKIDELSGDKKLNTQIKKELAVNIAALKDLRNSLSNKLSQSERDTFTLQQDILGFRMIPAALINPELQNLFNAETQKNKKDAVLKISGTSPSIDKFILQKLIGPLEAIIINSVTHGIEPPQERKRKNKPEKGTVEISYSETGGKIIITVRDDGCGIDFIRFKRLCMKIFPYESDEISAMTDDELIKYLFMQGITAGTADGFNSGSGQGLYNAYEGVQQVKGKISLRNTEPEGLEVTVTVPKSLTTVNGFFIRSAGEKFLIPSTFIDEIIYVNATEIIDLLTKHAVKVRNDIIPIFPLSGILKGSGSGSTDKMHVIIVNELGDKIGIIVDEILYHSSVIYKPMPKNVEKIKSLQGIVFDEEYNIVNILHIPEITHKLKAIRNIEFREKFSSANLRYKNILIVDDSELNRRIEKNIIVNLNVNIDEAYNGIDALSKIRDKHYDLIITDSKMPQMDGITFIENLRKENDYRITPVIVLASSNEEASDSRFRNLGVTHIFNKSYFNRDVLVETASNLLNSDNDE